MKAWALLFVLASGSIVARATPPVDAGMPLLTRLAPSPAERHQARTTARAEQLARLLESVPGIARAGVQLSLPDPSSAALDAPLPASRAAIVLQLRERGPSDREIARLAQSLVPELTQPTITVSRHPLAPPAGPRGVQVGPFDVAPASAGRLRMTLGASLACNAGLAMLLLWRTRRKRPRAPKVDPAGPGRPAR